MRFAGQTVEKKVTAATTGSTISTALVTLVLYALRNWEFLRDMDEGPRTAFTVVVATLVVGATTFVSGFMAKHTFRSREEVAAAER